MMARSAGITAAYTAHTIMADGLTAYQHELLQHLQRSMPALPWAETFDLNITPDAPPDHGQADDARRQGDGDRPTRP